MSIVSVFPYFTGATARALRNGRALALGFSCYR